MNLVIEIDNEKGMIRFDGGEEMFIVPDKLDVSIQEFFDLRMPQWVSALLEKLEKTQQALELEREKSRKWEKAFDNADKQYLKKEREAAELSRKLEQAQAENEQLKAMLDEAETFIQAISSFRGQNLEVANWHMNGDLEPLDNFFDENGIDEILTKIDITLRLSEVKGNV